MKVWIDQDLCIGGGLCVEKAPKVFRLVGGLSHVVEGDKVLPQGPDGLALVPSGDERAVIDAAEDCPGECIFVEVE